ncbi:DUF2933 domain-containing protein, partial [Escherichia coli]
LSCSSAAEDVYKRQLLLLVCPLMHLFHGHGGHGDRHCCK